MKTNVAFAKSLLLVASFGLVLPMLAKPPAKPAAAKQEETAKTDEPEPTIPGRVINRANGTFLSLTIENNALKLAFYDAKKKPMAADVARANAHWNPKNKKNEERRVLNSGGDGMTLVSAPINPPYNFILYLNLLSENGDAVESFVVNYNQAGE